MHRHVCYDVIYLHPLLFACYLLLGYGGNWSFGCVTDRSTVAQETYPRCFLWQSHGCSYGHRTPLSWGRQVTSLFIPKVEVMNRPFATNDHMVHGGGQALGH